MVRSIQDQRLPTHLVNSIHSGQCVLFLGAGVSMDSGAPSATQLSEDLSDRFLPDEPVSGDLAMTVESIDAAIGRKDLNSYLARVFEPLRPAGALLSIPTYFWKSIYTTNYDTLAEAAYDIVPNPRQKVRPFYSDRDPLNLLQKDEVPLYKLHGCISRVNHSDGRLVFTTDDMIDSERRRKRFFSRLYDELSDFPVLYVGFSRSDNDFRRIIRNIEEAALDKSDLRRGFALQPNHTESQKLHWESKRTTLIDLKADPFFGALGRQLPEWSRTTTVEAASPSEGTLQARYPRVDSQLVSQLQENFEIVDTTILEVTPNAEEFFLGGQANWGLVAEGAGAQRDIEDTLIANSLKDRAFDPGYADLTLLHAEAGSGKTTLLRRTAVSLSLEWDQSVLALKPFGELDLLSIERLADITSQRVYVFIDQAGDYAKELDDSIRKANRAKIKVSFIVTERTNEWREATYDLDLQVSREYELSSLSNGEIVRILDELEKHGSLGMLVGLSREAQVAAFTVRANKQLLVALKEATAGKRFDDIITDEYDSIPTQEGQRAYLLVAALHRFGIYTRAGLLHRCLDIPLSRVGDMVLEPTEKIIISNAPIGGNDTYYTTRHPLIADILVDRKLVSDRRRLDFYTKIIQQLDLGYSSDQDAWRRLTRTHNRQILRDFELGSDRRDLMGQMISRDPEDPYTLQHAAMMELDNRNLSAAADYLEKALKISPQNSAILDTKGRWYIKMSQDTKNPTLIEEYLASAEQIFRRNIQRAPNEPHGYRHLSEVYVEWSLRASNEAEQLRFLGLAHQTLLEGIDRCSLNTMLLQKQADLVQKVEKDYDKARGIFATILANRPNDTASRMLAARLETNEGDLQAALRLLREGLEHDGLNPKLHFETADLMGVLGGYSTNDVIGHFEAALLGSIRDLRPRLAYGAFLFSQAEYTKSSAIFSEISALDLGARRSRSTLRFEYGPLKDKATGKIVSLTQSSGRADYNQGAVSIYFSMRDVKPKVRGLLQRGSLVSFEIRFNDLGAIAVSVDLAPKKENVARQSLLELTDLP